MSRTWGGTLLVSGTCIGAGILALPLATGHGGFGPSLLIFALCWLFMCATGLLFLEVCLWMGKGTNIVSMAERTLGPFGKTVAWFLYLYLFYSLTVAYVSGGGTLISEVSDFSPHIGMFLFTAFFGTIVYFGARIVDKTNVILVAGLAITYVIFVAIGLPKVRISLLTHANWRLSFAAIPLIFTSFAYQGIVPSLTDYLERNPEKVRRAIIFGSFIPFVVYVIWDILILGIVPVEEIAQIIGTGGTSVSTLKEGLFLIGEFFSFFALTSSFLGVTLGLRDFLADGLHIKKTPMGRLGICVIIFLPALLISLTDPRLFLMALEFGAGTGVALLLGLLPVVMTWAGRYVHKLEGPYRVRGGKGLLIILGLFVVAELIAEFT